MNEVDASDMMDSIFWFAEELVEPEGRTRIKHIGTGNIYPRSQDRLVLTYDGRTGFRHNPCAYVVVPYVSSMGEPRD